MAHEEGFTWGLLEFDCDEIPAGLIHAGKLINFRRGHSSDEFVVPESAPWVQVFGGNDYFFAKLIANFRYLEKK